MTEPSAKDFDNAKDVISCCDGYTGMTRAVAFKMATLRVEKYVAVQKERDKVQKVYAKCKEIVGKRLKENNEQCKVNERLPLSKWSSQRTKLDVIASFGHVGMALIDVCNEIQKAADKAKEE